jgi:hypothetical protein
VHVDDRPGDDEAIALVSGAFRIAASRVRRRRILLGRIAADRARR